VKEEQRIEISRVRKDRKGRGNIKLESTMERKIKAKMKQKRKLHCGKEKKE
jgi:hypothetical protein